MMCADHSPADGRCRSPRLAACIRPRRSRPWRKPPATLLAGGGRSIWGRHLDVSRGPVFGVTLDEQKRSAPMSFRSAPDSAGKRDTGGAGSGRGSFRTARGVDQPADAGGIIQYYTGSPLLRPSPVPRFVVPWLQEAGSDTPPYLINEERTFTDGRIVLVGGNARCYSEAD